MIRAILRKNSKFNLSDAQLDEIMEMANKDIRFNRIGFNKLTSSTEVVNIAMRCLRTYERCL